MDADRIIVGGPYRALVGLVLFCAAVALVWLGFRLGWGIGWMAWIPAAFLVLPAAALGSRRELRRCPQGLEIIDGRLFRRGYEVALAGAELEILPAGGAWAAVLHLGGRELPLASWVRRSTAERIGALCDRCHPAGSIPRRAARRPEGDR